MVVFRYEWKHNRTYILVWAAVLAICIFCMTPIYQRLIGTPEELPEGFAQGGFFETLGVSLALLKEPLGTYSFLTGFFMIAGGIFGMHLGLSLYAKECIENTAEFLYTKPCGRKTIYWAKTLCLLCGVCMVGITYLLFSYFALSLFQSGFPLAEFLLYAISFVLVTLFFGALGLLWGACRPNNRFSLLTAGVVVFIEFCITAFSNTIQNYILGFLSPFTFFKPIGIHALGFYRMDYLIWYLILTAVVFIASYKVLMKRDIKFMV